MLSPSLIALVPAAGTGARARGAEKDTLPKQYRLLAGLSMLRHAVLALLKEARIAEVQVAVAPDDRWVAQALAHLPRTVWRPCGGDTRAQTVENALRVSGVDDQTWVLVHDAARPGLSQEALRRLIDACLPDPVGGLLALPVCDTVKVGTERVVRTEERRERWLAQTPQMFRAGMLRQALRAAMAQGLVMTDEAAAIEAAGYAPLLIPGTVCNFKVTWPEDFALMEKFLL